MYLVAAVFFSNYKSAFTVSYYHHCISQFVGFHCFKREFSALSNPYSIECLNKHLEHQDEHNLQNKQRQIEFIQILQKEVISIMLY